MSTATTTDFAPSQGFVVPYERVFANLRRGAITADDGTRVVYEVVGRDVPGAETIVLANGLGGRLYSWLPLIDALGDRYRQISWDYRGLFDSDLPEDRRKITIHRHAKDVTEILDAEGIKSAHFFGWSMGVQVSLEFTLCYPERALSLVLINGTYGQVFSTAMQPFFSVPIPHTVWHAFIEFGLEHQHILAALGGVAQKQMETLFWVRKRLLGKKRSRLTLMMRQYVKDLFNTNLDNYLRLFQQLDAHSVYHLLGEIDVPTTIISGGLDYLTPARQSRAMARRIPGAKHVELTLGTHYVLVERTARVVEAVEGHFGAQA